MSLKKVLKDDDRGFIFTLDGTLAVLISILGLAAVTTVGGSTTIYEQHGYQGLKEYANETLQVMEVGGTIDDIEYLIEQDNNQDAKKLARSKLLEILPGEIQFRMEIGSGSDYLLIYPTSGNLDNWKHMYENAEDVARAVRISYVDNNFEPFILYLWRGERI